MELQVIERVSSRERRLRRRIDVEGFDARTIDRAHSVRLLRSVPTALGAVYEQALLVTFGQSGLQSLSRDGWGGWYVVDEQDFTIASQYGPVEIYRRQLDPKRDSSGTPREHGSLRLEETQDKRAINWSAIPGPFSREAQAIAAEVVPYQPLSLWSFRWLESGDDLRWLEKIAVVLASDDDAELVLQGYARDVYGERKLRGLQVHRPTVDRVYEGHEVWRFQERSILGLTEYAASLGFIVRDQPIPSQGGFLGGSFAAQLTVRLVDDAGNPVPSSTAELERIEHALMNTDEAGEVEWLPDGEETEGTYRWELASNDRSALIHYLRTLVRTTPDVMEPVLRVARGGGDSEWEEIPL
jgi:hypothetical protein